jgi:hypothetical protein
VRSQSPPEEKLRYVRPNQDQWVTECRFRLMAQPTGWSVESVTERNDSTLTLKASYDPNDVLTNVSVTLAKGEKKQAAGVDIGKGKRKGKVKIIPDGQEAQEFDVPRGVIVTSAPDWTDTLLLCRRYDRKQGGKQSASGLWIHPTQPAQALTFTIERTGTATMEHEGRKLKLDRYTIHLRGNSAYTAWADEQGRMIKLQSAPAPGKTPSILVLEGYEKSAVQLKPAAP